MALTEDRVHRGTGESRLPLVVIGIITLFVIVGFVWFVWSAKHSRSVSNAEPRLAGAVRQGSPEFEEYRRRILLDPPVADEAKRALGDWVMTLQTTARNFTGHTIRGLEIHAAVVDHQGNPIRERTVIIIPGRQPDLEQNKTLPISIMLEGMRDTDDRANITMDVAAFKFE